MEKNILDKVDHLLSNNVSEKKDNQNHKNSKKKIFPINQNEITEKSENIMILNIFNPETGEYIKKAVRKIKN